MWAQCVYSYIRVLLHGLIHHLKASHKTENPPKKILQAPARTHTHTQKGLTTTAAKSSGSVQTETHCSGRYTSPEDKGGRERERGCENLKKSTATRFPCRLMIRYPSTGPEQWSLCCAIMGCKKREREATEGGGDWSKGQDLGVGLLLQTARLTLQTQHSGDQHDWQNTVPW